MILKDVGKLIAYFTKNSSEVNFLLGFSFFVQIYVPCERKHLRRPDLYSVQRGACTFFFAQLLWPLGVGPTVAPVLTG
jgi:hypothetical protein